MIILNSITVDKLRNLDYVDIIDIRSEEKYNDINAYNIPYDKLLICPNNYIEKDKVYYIYCQKGITSRKLCNILNSKGYNVININGGYEAWILTE